MAIMWHHERLENGTLMVTIDRQGEPVNSLSREALEELARLLEYVRTEPEIRAVIFQSGKPGNFIAGADVKEISGIQSADEAKGFSELGHQVFRELETMIRPTVAVIDGACLGGGLEFALACNYRIASDGPKTLIGLPEVNLGLIPGWGGTVRLPEQIGFLNALPLMLTGRMLNGHQARSQGIVHDVVPAEALPSVAHKIVKTHLASQSREETIRQLFRKRGGGFVRWVTGLSPAKKLALRRAEKEVGKKTRGNYPAPLKLIEALRKAAEGGREAGFRAESKAVADLAKHPVTRELIRLFFLQEQHKKPPESITGTVPPDSVQNAAVIGAGAMGAGIALLWARKNVWVRLKDIQPEFLASGMRSIQKILTGERKKKRLTPLQESRIWEHLSPTLEYAGLGNAQIVLEAIVEDLAIKQQMFQEVAKQTSETTVLATNTSSLKVADIAAAVPHPERVVGVHFFNPPGQMPLVEIVRTPRTSPAALATAVAAVQKLGKTLVVVGDCTGFVVNRLLAPYMNEAGWLLSELRSAAPIEQAAIDFGMPMGPLALIDLVGVDVAAHVARNMEDSYGSRMQPAPIWDVLIRLKGQHKGKKPFKLMHGKKLNRAVAKALEENPRMKAAADEDPISETVIINRLIYPIINEATRCLAEGVVERPEDIDVAMVFGTGFAPFRGGPLRFAESAGVSHIVETLEYLSAKHPRLAPSEALRRYARGGAEMAIPVKSHEPTAPTPRSLPAKPEKNQVETRTGE